jgi:hypothetical protein
MRKGDRFGDVVAFASNAEKRSGSCVREVVVVWKGGVCWVGADYKEILHPGGQNLVNPTSFTRHHETRSPRSRTSRGLSEGSNITTIAWSAAELSDQA